MEEKHKYQFFTMAFKFKIREENLQNQISQLEKSLEDLKKFIKDEKRLRQKQLQESKNKTKQMSLLKQQLAQVKNELQHKNKLLQIITKQLNKTQEQFESTKRQLDQLKNKNILLQTNNELLGDNQKQIIQYQAIKQETENNKNNEIIIKPQNAALRKQLFKNSKILTTQQYSQTLINLFEPLKIKSVKLLYRASQNEFSVKKFHKECDKIRNTLVIVKTKYEKMIGGYTPCEFKGNGFLFVSDQSKKSFIFSLTNNDKFVLQNQHKAIKNEKYCGPSFGQGPDLLICDKASTNQNSMANINVSYKNTRYKAHDSESWQRFHGNKQSAKFGIQQWQVFALQLF